MTNPIKTRRRCPNGQRRVPAITGNCVPWPIRGGKSDPNGMVVGGVEKWKLFTAREIASLSAISVRTMAEKLRPMFQINAQKTTCEILSAIYEVKETPVIVNPNKRGRPKKVAIDVPKNTHAVLTRNKCLLLGLLYTAFPSVVPSGCMGGQLAFALLKMSGESTPKRAPEKCVRFIESTLSIWTNIQIPAYYEYIHSVPSSTNKG